MKQLGIVFCILTISVGIGAQDAATNDAKPKRWVHELKHVNPNAICMKLQFTPDSKELLGGDYPGGKIVLWDVTSGETQSLFDAGHGSRGNAEYFHLTKDGKTLFTDDSHKRPKITEIKKDDKVLRHWEMDGAVHAWKLETGDQLPRYQHQPPSLIIQTHYAPDGMSFYTLEEPGGEFTGRPPRTVSIWDVKTHQSRNLPVKTMSSPTYSADSQTLAVAVGDESVIKEILFLDVKTLQERRRQPLKQSQVNSMQLHFSNDGKWLIGKLRKKTDGEEPSYWTPQLVIWNAQTGDEVFTYTGENQTDWIYPNFSNDHRYLTLSNWYPPIHEFKDVLPRERRGQVFIIDLERKKLAHQVILTEAATGDATASVSQAYIHPHGKVLVAMCSTYRQIESDDGDKPAFKVISKPEVVCIEVASGKVIERIEHPKGYLSFCDFSPDGKLLAISSKGGVQLWNVADWCSK